mgnify:CR=1 FL=1
MKLTLVRVHQLLDPAQAAIHVTVHDELDMEVRPGYTETAMNIVAGVAKEVLPGVELPIEFELGPNWGELTEVTTESLPSVLAGMRA